MNNLLTALLNIGRRQRILNLFNRRRNNRGMVWMSLLGLGVSAAAAFGIKRNRNRNVLSPVQNLMNNMQTRQPSMSMMNEFAKELMPNKNK